MLRRFLGLGTFALFTTWTVVGSAQDYNVRLGTPAGAQSPAGTVVIINGPITQTGGCSACAAAAAAPVTVGSCGCKAPTLTFQPCACDAGAKVVTVGCSSCSTGACSTGACSTGACSTGACSTGACSSCGCGLPVSACEQKPRPYCQPRAVVIPNPCACSTCAATPCTACAPRTCATCAATSPSGSGCSSPTCGCASEQRPMFPIIARLRHALSGDIHASTCSTCNTCNKCSTCGTGSCASGSCGTSSCSSCSANAGVVVTTPVAAAPVAPTTNVPDDGRDAARPGHAGAVLRDAGHQHRPLRPLP